jgi:opacity protein-like surface antigen
MKALIRNPRMDVLRTGLLAAVAATVFVAPAIAQDSIDPVTGRDTITTADNNTYNTRSYDNTGAAYDTRSPAYDLNNNRTSNTTTRAMNSRNYNNPNTTAYEGTDRNYNPTNNPYRPGYDRNASYDNNQYDDEREGNKTGPYDQSMMDDDVVITKKGKINIRSEGPHANGCHYGTRKASSDCEM